MPPSEDEIRRRLAEFAARWGGYHGSERAEAQTFLNELLACYGVDRQAAGARFEEHRAGGFMDLFWPGVCIVEMKRPSEVNRLAEHREQALGTGSSPERRAPRRRATSCSAPSTGSRSGSPAPSTPSRALVLDLVDLPDNLDALNFLAGRNPVFEGGGADLTREAVALVTDLYSAAPRAPRRRPRRPPRLHPPDASGRCSPRTFICCRRTSSRASCRSWRRIPHARVRTTSDGSSSISRRQASALATGSTKARRTPTDRSSRVPRVCTSNRRSSSCWPCGGRIQLAEGRAGDLRRAAPRRSRSRTPVGSRRALHGRGGHPEGRPPDRRRAVARTDRRLPDARGRRGGAARPDALRRP